MGMIHYCQNNDMNCFGYSHTFIENNISETTRRIVIRNVEFVFGEQTYTSIRVDYDVHIILQNMSETIFNYYFTIDERRYNRMMERL